MTADLAIVGAGPAGMAAAVLAAELGLDTDLIDEQPMPGGQIYRAVEAAPADTPLGADYLKGRELVSALRASGVRYRPGTTVWHIDAAGRLFLSAEGRTVLVPEGASAAAAVLVAGLGSIRETAVGGVGRAPYCMMGVCFDCLSEIDGEPNRQSCMVPVRPGMRIRRQLRARRVEPA